MYELTLVLRPDLTEEELETTIEEVKKLIAGEVVTPRRARGDLERSREVKEDTWGKRVLAYPIDQFEEGFYYLLNFEMTPPGVGKLREKLNLKDDVLRFLIVRTTG